MSTTVRWITAAALVIAAWFVAWLTPDDDAHWSDPFVVPAEVGETATARDLVATVDQVRWTPSVSTASWQDEGTWLVIDLTVASRTEPKGIWATLEIDGDTYAPSNRPPTTEAGLGSARLIAGVPQSGALAFELPDDASGEAVLHLSNISDTRLDSVIHVTIDLDATEEVAHVDLPKYGWAS